MLLFMTTLPPGQEVIGWMKFFQDYGHLATVMLMLGIFGLGVIVYKLQKLLRQIDLVATSCLDTDGKPLKPMPALLGIADRVRTIETALHMHDQAAQAHYTDVARLTDEDHWKNCPVDKCPNLQQLTGRMHQIAAALEANREAANTSDQLTRQELSTLAAELHHLAMEIIAAMRTTRERSNGHEE